MRLLNALGVAEDPYAEEFQNIIANILQVVVVDAPVLSPHVFHKLEPKLSRYVDAFFNP